MQMQIVRTTNTTRITRRTTPSGGGQSLREIVKEITTIHDQWIGKWEDSKPLTNTDQKELREEMMKLASEAGLI